jgi:hypothetical protein
MNRAGLDLLTPDSTAAKVISTLGIINSAEKLDVIALCSLVAAPRNPWS